MTDEVKAEAQRIRDELASGKLYGRPVNLDDPDEVLVAAYHAGYCQGGASGRELHPLLNLKPK